MFKKYFLYILEHKINVFRVCIKKGMFIHAFTHDLSKFLPDEFFAYAHWFYGEYGVNATQEFKTRYCEMHYYRKAKFQEAFARHQRRNKHHWNYWIGKDMPRKYVKQMVCDWEAMGLKFGNSAKEFYARNYDNIELSTISRIRLEMELGIADQDFILEHGTWENYCKKNNITMIEDLIQRIV